MPSHPQDQRVIAAGIRPAACGLQAARGAVRGQDDERRPAGLARDANRMGRGAEIRLLAKRPPWNAQLVRKGGIFGTAQPLGAGGCLHKSLLPVNALWRFFHITRRPEPERRREVEDWLFDTLQVAYILQAGGKKRRWPGSVGRIGQPGQVKPQRSSPDAILTLVGCKDSCVPASTCFQASVDEF